MTVKTKEKSTNFCLPQWMPLQFMIHTLAWACKENCLVVILEAKDSHVNSKEHYTES